jgi:calcium-dependent protein kinase
MLTYDENARVSAAEALGHPWIHSASRVALDTEQARSIFDNLSNFRTEKVMQKAAMTFIAS